MEYEQLGLLHDMFIRQARLTPDAVAVVSDDGSQLTFAELDSLTDCLATNLRICGVVADSIVGIYMEKGIDYTVSYIAILKAGGAYLPIDVSYPPPLLESVLEDSQPAAIIINHTAPTQLKDAKKIITLDDDWSTRLKAENDTHGGFDSPPTVHLDNLAYVVYSSGTTGKPKGIMCPHRGAVYSYHWRHTNYPFQSDERVACNVFFVWEMLRSILKGIPMYIIPDNVIYDPALLVSYLKRHRITRILFTPSLLETVINTENLDVADGLSYLRLIWFCGEVVTTALRDRVGKILPKVKLLNLYSISECHDVAVANLSKEAAENKNNSNGQSNKFCSVGTRLPDVHVIIMDDNLHPLPVGAPGEIYVGGPTLARGYLNRPQLNAERFIDRPPAVPEYIGKKLYKTGDWGYVLSDGGLEICGRCDSMVKIRGYSIETQAVEAALLELPMVNANVVLALGDEGTDKYLVAYIVPEGDATRREIRAELKKRLPPHMIPAYLVFLSSIPILAASGKLDKKSLPPIDLHGDRGDEICTAASTETEKMLASLWADILRVRQVDVQENFFDLGGHSLLAAKLLSLIKDKVKVEITVRDLFQHSTVSAMAKLIDAKLKKTEDIDIVCKEPVLNLMSEVVRHDQGGVNINMQLRAFWRSIQYGNRWKSGRVFLTGATGFLGAFILRDLLQHTELHIYCLVREPPDASCMERLQTSLQGFGILPSSNECTEEQQEIINRFNKRVTAIKGDVSLLRLGMNEEDFTYLTYEIDFVIHCAAYVNLVYPYKALHGINVVGTQNVILFASTNKIKPLHYISTNSVFPNDCKDANEDADMTQYANELTDGYSQTKWVAEQLVLKARSRGLPVAIYRPGNLSGESHKAYWNPTDSHLLLLRGCVETHCAPNKEWDIEMTPVDFVSNIIVQMTQNIMLAVGKVFHLVNPKPFKSIWLFEWMKAHGYTMHLLPFNEWCQQIEKLKTSTNNHGTRVLGERLTDIIKNTSYFSHPVHLSISNLQKVMSSLNLSYPQLNADLLATYFKNLAERGIIAKPKKTISQGDKPLAGSVAIVTGASSGIGAAVAKHLAEAGAMVAMAARRVDKLNEIQESIEKGGGVAIAVKTDVCNKDEVKALVKHTESTLGPVDIIVNNAGVMYYTLMKNLNEDQWERTIDVNCKGVVNGVGAVLSGMISRGKGHIVNMSSNAGRRAFPGLAVYSGTKFFVEAMSSALRQELIGTGVKVTTIQPGDVKTDLAAENTDKEAIEKYDMSSTYDTLQAADIGRAVVYAVSQPPYVGVNEILIEPREGPAV